MNDNFEKIYKFILSIEGTYSNNPYDRGGETWAGLTKNFLISHSLRVPPDWETIYSGYRIVYEYLKDPDKKTFLLDELPYSLSLVIFDLLFHHGFTLGTKILQVALCVDSDGIYGPKTHGRLLELAKQNQYALCFLFISFKMRQIYRIIVNDSSQRIFAAGWLKRIYLLQEEIIREMRQSV